MAETKIITPPTIVDYRKFWKKNLRERWFHKIRIFGIYFYISNCRLRKRARRDFLIFKGTKEEIRQKLYERQGCRCAMCGREQEKNMMQLHHYLPIARFEEFAQSIRNQVLLCNECHKEIHLNPYLNIRLIEEKAKELGVDLDERYNRQTKIIDYGIERHEFSAGVGA